MEKNSKNNFKKILIGVSAGVISGLFTAGGGLILVPAFMYMLKMEPKKTRSTSIFCILPMVITTAIIYSKNNLINWKTGLYCAIGGILGGAVGAILLNKVHDKYLKIIFAIFLIYASYNMLF